ncbi:glycoside hydrolase family 32 protein [Streptomyces sp. 8K308]|uniref:glycoside hydrolase family 32 protein n=1 Tax=Streptomyces sp. 8K308 TaxID=2530388 RepID=UPI00104B73E2|nr:glycoside hydrolase family 32 protein [Streptomyces sp. 8K308]TDC27976.1 glycoside hydrolase family 32 protein [Streptomyces sp. 8K308]
MTPQHDPRLHVRPRSGWINDPNGPFRWRGRYHLFYQYNPAAPVHADIHWGHASSVDLVRWEHHPPALAPTPGGPDAAGCWSGCVVDDGGTPTAVYTGVDASHVGLGTICLARAADPADELLAAWTPVPTPVVDGPPPGLDVTMFRDPFVFLHAGRRWALVGAGHGDGTPSVLLYDVDDLTRWRFAGVLLDGRDPLAAKLSGPGATGWECPQLFRASADEDGDWVLVLSLWDGSPVSVGYLTGRLRAAGDTLTFSPRVGGPLDHGRDCYAPAVLQETDRALLWGWSWEARPERAVAEAGWAGVLTHPREVSTHEDGSLRVAPAPELTGLRAALPLVADQGHAELPGAYEIELAASGGPVTVELSHDAAGDPLLAVHLDPTAGRVVLDRSALPREGDGARGSEHPESGPVELPVPPGTRCTVRILADGSLLEVFAGRHAVATERLYQRPGDRASLTVRAATPGGYALTAWELAPPRRR